MRRLTNSASSHTRGRQRHAWLEDQGQVVQPVNLSSHWHNADDRSAARATHPPEKSSRTPLREIPRARAAGAGAERSPLRAQVCICTTRTLRMYLFTCLKNGATEREGETERGSLPKWPQWPGLAQATARSRRFHSGLTLVARAQLFAPSATPAPAHWQGTRLEVEQPRLELALPQGCWCRKQWPSPPHHAGSHPHFPCELIYPGLFRECMAKLASTRKKCASRIHTLNNPTWPRSTRLPPWPETRPGDCSGLGPDPSLPAWPPSGPPLAPVSGLACHRSASRGHTSQFLSVTPRGGTVVGRAHGTVTAQSRAAAPHPRGSSLFPGHCFPQPPPSILHQRFGLLGIIRPSH
nr:uncharacterized protein LOC127485805 [Oryctolagus cuniculus]XP_051685199.1 uncharacterized protein LOC127485805 [Oryctolagus cuniculus]XP_051685200.1 uncharacterized protein LOC127485805 [Oryctolagus cuniculus]XP_051685201.1 uncharacterized protein LOC127485805 [Oryctolagus cuniculus]XP_051685202.1 uncharacterized protein LOC127485805 [Oryctolagus cuniculus]XP_051685203.1 uncharacterized protein LOC127485805 [Oryctolagus cuniculus]XP_051685204.1 uncharacterized protein LOC127485805 [Orycto